MPVLQQLAANVQNQKPIFQVSCTSRDAAVCRPALVVGPGLPRPQPHGPAARRARCIAAVQRARAGNTVQNGENDAPTSGQASAAAGAAPRVTTGPSKTSTDSGGSTDGEAGPPSVAAANPIAVTAASSGTNGVAQETAAASTSASATADASAPVTSTPARGSSVDAAASNLSSTSATTNAATVGADAAVGEDANGADATGSTDAAVRASADDTATTIGADTSNIAADGSGSATTVAADAAAASSSRVGSTGSGIEEGADGIRGNGGGNGDVSWSDDPIFLRRAAGAQSANELLDLVFDEVARCTTASGGSDTGACPAPQLTDQECRAIIRAALERGNTDLAVALFDAMRRSSGASAASASSARAATAAGQGIGGSWSWPAASLETTCTLVLGLARCLCVKQAQAVVATLRHSGGVAQSEEVVFGHVVASPLAPPRSPPLAVVRPQEGVKTVACATTRYEYELYSGTVTRVESEATVSSQGLLLAFARAVRLWRKPPTGAVHEVVVATPSGQSRTFRFATSTADVPAREGDRVTFVCCPATPSARAVRPLLRPTPPGLKPGEPILASNHSTAADTLLQRPPAGGGEALPGWVVPAAVLLAGGDAAAWLVDPSLPLIATGSLAAVAASGLVGSAFVLPRLRQLPETSIAAEALRARLLAQHTSLTARLCELQGGSAEDVATLARLWQLQSKMGTVGGGSAYQVRMERVVKACSGLEERLSGRLKLMDGYARVLSMIEIEVELDTEVPQEELLGIEEQIQRLSEVEELQETWQLQAEAQDEVEKLLKSM